MGYVKPSGTTGTHLDLTMSTDATAQDHEKITARLRRIEGQIRGIARMLEEDRACEDVVTQLMAVRSSIDNVGAVVLDVHLGKCIEGTEPGSQVDALRDAMRLWWRFAPGAGSAEIAANEVGAQSPLPSE